MPTGNDQILCGRRVGGDSPLFFIVGPCVIESEALVLCCAEALATIAERMKCLIIFKSSFDKANRSSSTSFRGLGIDEGLRILEKVKREVGLPVLTDIHDAGQVRPVADVVDVLQTPAFLARQTDLIAAAATSGRPVNVKKAQYMAPSDMHHVIDKARTAAHLAGCADVTLLITERGTSFGYNNLVVDMRGLATMATMGCPVVFDATHSVQLPGGNGITSGGQREFVPLLARAAVAAGVNGVFLETHPNPDEALSDGPNALPLAEVESLLHDLTRFHEVSLSRLSI